MDQLQLQSFFACDPSLFRRPDYGGGGAQDPPTPGGGGATPSGYKKPQTVRGALDSPDDGSAFAGVDKDSDGMDADASAYDHLDNDSDGRISEEESQGAVLILASTYPQVTIEKLSLPHGDMPLEDFAAMIQAFEGYFQAGPIEREWSSADMLVFGTEQEEWGLLSDNAWDYSPSVRETRQYAGIAEVLSLPTPAPPDPPPPLPRCPSLSPSPSLLPSLLACSHVSVTL